MPKRTVQATKKRGRPTSLTDEMADTLVACRLKGLSLALCAKEVGISKDTLIQWLKAETDFSYRFDQAESRAVGGLIDEMRQDPKNHAKLLDRAESTFEKDAAAADAGSGGELTITFVSAPKRVSTGDEVTDGN